MAEKIHLELRLLLLAVPHAHDACVTRLRDLLEAKAGANLDQRYGHLLFRSEPKYVQQARMVESRISKFSGVLEVAVAPTGEIRIEFDRQVTDEALWYPNQSEKYVTIRMSMVMEGCLARSRNSCIP